MLVFRDERRTTELGVLTRELLTELEQTSTHDAPSAVLPALLRAAELECAVSDAGVDARAACALTDYLARVYVGGGPAPSANAARSSLAAYAASTARIDVKRPEGYAYYALDPAAYAHVAAELSGRSGPALVLGVRSIGTGLSAVVAQALVRRGFDVSRFTVRPTGHPWARALTLSDAERARVARVDAAGGRFVVVDEGPGMSGSTLLAVGEALLRERVPRERITILCSHRPDPRALVASRAAERWAGFEVRAAASALRPDVAGALELSAGAWRWRSFAREADFPAVWVQQERLKFLDPRRGELHKFEGLPPYGGPAYERSAALFEAGFGPQPLGFARGFVKYRWLAGTPLTPALARAGALERIARYCALRAELFPAEHCDQAALEQMARVNVQESFGLELAASFRLELEQPTHVDGRMLPHEWIATGDRPEALMKTDGVAHGDGHLYPGPTDLLWDVAGAIIELELDESRAEQLVASSIRGASPGARERLERYALAYAAFRAGWAEMALAGASDDERPRLERARQRYRDELWRWLTKSGLAPCSAARALRSSGTSREKHG